jgi:pre-rRNA-processing protein IPI3
VTALAVDPSSRYFVTGSKDSNVLVWSLNSLLSLSGSDISNSLSLNASDPRAPIHTLSAHRGSITALATGHSHPNSNIAISASEDRTAIIWHYKKGVNLRTYLLGDVPRAIAIDAADRAFYTGYSDGSIQALEFYGDDSNSGPASNVANETGHAAPVQPPPHTRWRPPADTGPDNKRIAVGAVLSLAMSYDSTRLLSGHESGRIANWNVGRRQFLGDVCTLPGRVTNLAILPPTGFAKPKTRPFKVHAVTKPRVDLGNDAPLDKYVFTAELTGEVEDTKFSAFETPQKDGRAQFGAALAHVSFPEEMLWDGIRELDQFDPTLAPPATNTNSSPHVDIRSDPVGTQMDLDAGEEQDGFISLDVGDEAGAKEPSVEEQNEQLKKQIESLQRTQKESFKMMGELRKERAALVRELKDRGDGG